mmetsp:Transcript_12982/g.21223  ORF Transcript_12982/g.21223 Transcript_12982/m.21223 type:complete len:87 (+) Transcript_12982:1416-1676(+)
MTPRRWLKCVCKRKRSFGAGFNNTLQDTRSICRFKVMHNVVLFIYLLMFYLVVFVVIGACTSCHLLFKSYMMFFIIVLECTTRNLL